MDSLESKGKTVDEAIYNGLKTMGLGIDEVQIEIVHEGSKGIFGLGKSAVVRLVKKEETKLKNSDAVAFLNGLFEKMKVDATCAEQGADEKTVKVEISGRDTTVLIGRRGETLDAIQYLVGLVVNRERDEYRKIMLDAENYRQKREETLEKLARRLANNVIKSGKTVTLEPMNPYERRILHATLQSNPKVETYSEGEEPYRRVVIKRKKKYTSNSNVNA